MAVYRHGDLVLVTPNIPQFDATRRLDSYVGIIETCYGLEEGHEPYSVVATDGSRAYRFDDEVQPLPVGHHGWTLKAELDEIRRRRARERILAHKQRTLERDMTPSEFKELENIRTTGFKVRTS